MNSPSDELSHHLKGRVIIGQDKCGLEREGFLIGRDMSSSRILYLSEGEKLYSKKGVLGRRERR